MNFKIIHSMLPVFVAFLAATAVEAVPLLDNHLAARSWQSWSTSSSNSVRSAATSTFIGSSTSARTTFAPTVLTGSTLSTRRSTSSTRTSSFSRVSITSTKASAVSSAAPTDSTIDYEPCAVVSAASASLQSEYPEATQILVDPSEALACLDSIPVVYEDAQQLLGGLRTYCEFQSDKEYLRTPPDGYTNPAYDIDADFDVIQARLDAGSYDSEFAFQTDLNNVIQQAFDGHFAWRGDILNGVFDFQLYAPGFIGLASASVDGIEAPQIYFTSDLVSIQKDGTFVPQQRYKPSPVTQLNGIDITEAVEVLSLLQPIQDPDSRYNNMFWVQGRISSPTGNFLNIPQPPRSYSSYDFTFANGSEVSFPILASVLGDFTDVYDGESAYAAFALFHDAWEDTDEEPADNSTVTSSTIVSSATIQSVTGVPTATATTTATSLPNIPGFPYPVVKDDSNLIAGYYLNGTMKDVAVLQITSFLSEESDTFMEDAQEALRVFLTKAKSDSKTKLIIDVQGNGGGSIDLGTDIFVQLFPNVEPNQSGNMRRSAAMDIIIETGSQEVMDLELTSDELDEDLLAKRISPFNVEYSVTPDNVNIETVDQYLDGITYGGGNFTTFFQTNYTDPYAFLSTDFNITQTDPSAKPVFAPENVVLLTDGLCASSCTVFAERLKNLVGGIPQILAGGRPTHSGPVQAVGGIKGSQIFDGQQIAINLLGLYQNASAESRAPLNGTEWDYFTFYPIVRTSSAVLSGSPASGLSSIGVNGRNSFRIGDTTNTPLQYVYDAADCRIWYTPEMLYNPSALWNRVAEVAFSQRSGLAYDSKYCVAGSTGHPTAYTGGWKKGTLGPQGQGLVERASPIFENAPWIGEYSQLR